ncbi:TIGR04149 family rSAM-modified RiPP [Dysgonomonas sp. ZJ709]|uniref:TIGR04149 family rSAM-modified RiPP n=1 Tax=Dysgonomonas sp. ZJ709 TaxID=2709797 RepID=UPI0013ED83BF|nr:TIGR04149 family rSAM-modified RiPP [Dysgonomonas sp. ZJ709]
MKKINLKGISEVLSERELKNVKGGSDTGSSACAGKSDGASCTCNGRSGTCKYAPFAGLICWLG